MALKNAFTFGFILLGVMVALLLLGHAATARAQAQVRCVRVLNAMQNVTAHSDRAEVDFENLGLPPEAVADPFTGQPLRFVRRPEGWLIDSVGTDLNDDGGQLSDHRGVGNGPGSAEGPLEAPQSSGG